MPTFKVDTPASLQGSEATRSSTRERQVNGTQEYSVAPAESLARLRKHVLDRVARGEATVARPFSLL